MVLTLSGCSVHVEGLENLQAVAPAVLAANHASYIDTGVLLATLPIEFRFVAKRRLTTYPLIRTVIRKAGYLTVEQFDPAKRAALADRTTAVLRGGTSLFFFPEGTFFRPPGLLPFRLGAFKTAVEAGRPVIPIGLRGTREILPDGTWLPKRGPISVAIGPPITSEGNGWEELVRLRNLARREIARLAGENLVPGRELV
jgi:1-acyl-sn-glycerol-3-phosphate acyltransferase